MFEEALVRVLVAEGLPVPAQSKVAA